MFSISTSSLDGVLRGLEARSQKGHHGASLATIPDWRGVYVASRIVPELDWRGASPVDRIVPILDWRGAHPVRRMIPTLDWTGSSGSLSVQLGGMAPE